MRGRSPIVASLILGLAVASCRHLPGMKGADGELAGPVGEGKSLLEKGELDAALAELQKAPDDPDSLYYQGRVWARKAESAPLPTPPPVTAPLPHGAVAPPAPELKVEEIQAAQLYERALAAKPDNAEAHLALAELLAPHAAHQHDLVEDAASHKRPLPPAPPSPVDASVDRVIRAYEAAMKADAASTAAVDGIIKFGRRVGRLDAAEEGFKEMVRRKKERETAVPLARYGDFLAQDKKDPLAAIEQYREALIWVPDDDATRAKIADIYLKLAVDAFAKQQYGVTDSQLRDASKYITDRSSAQAQLLDDYRARLKNIRR